MSYACLYMLCCSGEPVGVVAAEVTEKSLFVDVNNLLDGLCDEDYGFVFLPCGWRV